MLVVNKIENYEEREIELTENDFIEVKVVDEPTEKISIDIEEMMESGPTTVRYFTTWDLNENSVLCQRINNR